MPGEGGAITNDMSTEMALETTTTTNTDIAKKSEGEELSETQSLLQKVKQAGTAGGKNSFVYYHNMCMHNMNTQFNNSY
jgi:hypothetical protein